MAGAEERVARHHLPRARPVRNAGGVAEVDGVLEGKPRDEGAQDGQAADAAVEDSDRPRPVRAGIHRMRGCQGEERDATE